MLDKDKSSATLLHHHTNQTNNAHFTNIQNFQFNPSNLRLPEDFDDQIWKLFPEEYSLAKHNPQSIEKRR
jgi:hypothetical protein